ncbi:MAG: phosphomannomutase/phosphoglucomutase [Patescibacteria group bacterium]|nr:phosphomannomutase/phosphoglucomutase [Patescibacteria group bacterium]
MPNFDLSSFHDYDVRGIYPTAIDEDFFYHLGKSFALYFKNGPIGVGHDTRVHSPALAKAFIEGMTDYGVDVVDLGNISTEMHNYSLGKHPFFANVMITASHNPPEYNGVKSALHGVIPLHGGFGLPEVKAFMNQDIPKAQKKGTITRMDIFDEWIAHVQSVVDMNRMSKSMKVVVDAGNGMGGPAWERMRSLVPFEIVPLYLEPDGTFPNHVADPSKDVNLRDLIAKVKETGADLGIALDGDADRAVFVDDQGVKLSGTVATALFAEHFLAVEKGTILYDATVGQIVKDVVEQVGGTPVRTRVGHSFIKTLMREKHAIFAGEESGHYYFAKNYNAESSLMAGLLMVEILTEKGKKLSELRKEYDRYARSGETNFQVPDSAAMIAKLRESFEGKARSIDEIDGITFWFEDFWFIVRPSKTEPLLRLFMEANSPELLETHMREVVSVLKANGATQK